MWNFFHHFHFFVSAVITISAHDIVSLHLDSCTHKISAARFKTKSIYNNHYHTSLSLSIEILVDCTKLNHMIFVLNALIDAEFDKHFSTLFKNIDINVDG